MLRKLLLLFVVEIGAVELCKSKQWKNLRETLTSDFEIKVDGSRRKYVSLAFNRQTKNHRGDDLTDDDVKGGAMYELPGKCLKK